MTTVLKELALLGGLVLSLSSCSKDSNEPNEDLSSCTHTAYIIGVTPCGKQGYIIALESSRDTVSTYNLPEGLITYTPGVTPMSGRGDGLFAPSAFHKVKIGYSILADAERTKYACLGNINLNPFIRMTQGKEIKLLCGSNAL